MKSPRRSLSSIGLLLAGFLVAAVLVGAAGSGAGACPRRPYVPRDPRPALDRVNGRFEVRMFLSHHFFRFAGSNLQLKTIFVSSRDKAFATYLVSAPGNQISWMAFHQTARGLNCADVMSGQDLARVEKDVGKAIQAAYRKASGRTVAAPYVMLGLDGGYAVYCQPPASKTPP